MILPRRLDLVLSRATMPGPTRKERLAQALDAIARGVVSVNGKKATTGDALVYAEDCVAVDDMKISLSVPKSRVWAFHKPRRVRTDMREGPLLAAALSMDAKDPPMPVGQLDADTTGLMLFTDDGDLSMLINTPGAVRKHYLASIEARDSLKVPLKELNEMEEVLCCELVDKQPLPPPANGCGSRKARFIFSLVVAVGTFHIVKRIFARVKLSVRQLHRAAVGPLELDDIGGTSLATNESKELDSAQIEKLWTAIGHDRLFQHKLRYLHLRSSCTSDERLRQFLIRLESPLSQNP